MDLPPVPQDCIHRLERAAGRPLSTYSAVSTLHPLRVHWNRPEDEPTARALLAATEHAWTVQVDTIGFRAPVADDVDGPEVDLYLAQQAPAYAWTAADRHEDTVPGDGYNGTPAYAVFSRTIDPAWLDAYAAHEFNHLCQWATDFGEPSLPIWEGTATAAQAWTLGPSGNWASDVPSFQQAPNAPTLLTDGYQLFARDPELFASSTFEYGSALWVMALDELHGGGGTGAVMLWDAAASEGPTNEPDVVDAVAAIGPGDLADALNLIARARLLVGDDWREPGLIDAAEWDASRTVIPERLSSSEWRPSQLAITGQAFGHYDVPQASGTLALTWSSPSNTRSAVFVTDDRGGEWTGAGDTGEIAIPLDDVGWLRIAVSNLGPAGWDGDDDPWVPSDVALTLRTAAPVAEPAPAACGCATGSKTGTWNLLQRR